MMSTSSCGEGERGQTFEVCCRLIAGSSPHLVVPLVPQDCFQQCPIRCVYLVSQQVAKPVPDVWRARGAQDGFMKDCSATSPSPSLPFPSPLPPRLLTISGPRQVHQQRSILVVAGSLHAVQSAVGPAAQLGEARGGGYVQR